MGGEERQIARGAIAQQAGQVFGTLVMLGVVTLLGRSLTLAEFGVYGLLISVVAYLLIVQLSVEGAAVRAMASSSSAEAKARTFATALAIYALLGLAAGILIATGGVLLVSLLSIPSGLEHDARTAILVLAAVTAAGWPFKVFLDVLRAEQLFASAALAEATGYLAVGLGMAALVATNAPLWSLIALGGSLSVLIGLAGAALLSARGLPWPRPRAADRAEGAAMLRVAGQLLIAGLADIAIYSLDRVILAAFKGPATVGLYEAAVRPHNVLRQLHGTLVLTVVPKASGYIAASDQWRVRELLVRGTRYVLAIVAPVCTVLMVLSAPILEVWLGHRFRETAPALVILSSYWLVGANTGVAGSMLVAAGRARELARYAWMVASLNVGLMFVMTPILGLEGAAVAIAVPYLLLFPVFLRLVLRTFPVVSLSDLAREAWLPTYSLTMALAVGLVLARVLLDLESLAAVLAVALIALATYTVAWIALFATPGERSLLRSFVHR